jgi:hypothetical protein
MDKSEGKDKTVREEIKKEMALRVPEGYRAENERVLRVGREAVLKKEGREET